MINFSAIVRTNEEIYPHHVSYVTHSHVLDPLTSQLNSSKSGFSLILKLPLLQLLFIQIKSRGGGVNPLSYKSSRLVLTSLVETGLRTQGICGNCEKLMGN